MFFSLNPVSQAGRGQKALILGGVENANKSPRAFVLTCSHFAPPAPSGVFLFVCFQTCFLFISCMLFYCTFYPNLLIPFINNSLIFIFESCKVHSIVQSLKKLLEEMFYKGSFLLENLTCYAGIPIWLMNNTQYSYSVGVHMPSDLHNNISDNK